ncbi:hypothetical protein MMC13_006662 [Lambiella insularis]|nr:hypothetical protein [Lambiella insularis]
MPVTIWGQLSNDRKAASTGLQPRTQEVLQTLGLLSTVESKAVRVCEIASWTKDSTGKLSRESVAPGTVRPSRFPYFLAGDQGVVEGILEEDLRHRGHIVDYSLEILEYAYETNNSGLWPIKVFIKNHITEAVETWHAGYLLGCDGADSTIRRLVGIEAEYHGKEDVWLVADLSLDTNFPDARRRSTVKTAHSNCVLMPSTENRTRVITPLTPANLKSMGSQEYIQSPFPSLAGNKTSATTLVRFLHPRLSAILAPWDVRINDVSWIRRYHTTKRLATRFSDPTHHIFLLGDACHTHSPFTAHSMNAGMMDAHNLAWKLALVHRGLAKAHLLATYTLERLAHAQQLLDLDVSVDHTLQLPPADPAAHEGFPSGCAVRYAPGLLVKQEVRLPVRSAAAPLTPGTRLLDMRLTRHIDGNAVHLLDEMAWDGRFQLLVCLGALAFAAPVVVGLAAYLASAASPLALFSPPPLLDVFLLHTHDHYRVSLEELAPPFAQRAERVYEDVGGAGLASVGVNPRLGALVLVRPDGFVAVVTNLDDARGVMAFLDGFLNRQAGSGEGMAMARASGDEMVF